MGYRVNNDSCKGIGSNKILFSVGLYYLLAVLCTQKLHLSRINQRKSHQSVDSWMQHLFCNTARVSKATGWFGNWQCLKPSRCTEPLPDFFKEIQEQHIHTQKQTETYWSESKHGPTGLGGALPAIELPKQTLLSYSTVQQKSFCGSSARWSQGQYASMLCDRSDLRVSRTCNRLLMLSGKYGGVKLAHYGLVAPLTCHNWQIFKVPHDLYRQ